MKWLNDAFEKRLNASPLMLKAVRLISNLTKQFVDIAAAIDDISMMLKSHTSAIMTLHVRQEAIIAALNKRGDIEIKMPDISNVDDKNTGERKPN